MASFLTDLGTRPMRPAGPVPCPINLSKLKGLDISARYHPDRCGGEYFVGLTIGLRLIFLLSDIAIAAEAQTAFRQRATELFEAADTNESDAIAILAHDVNLSLMEAANGVHFAPTFLGCFNSTLGILTYCNAGRVLAIFSDATSVCVLERGGVPLGLFSHITYEPAVLAFEAQDKLLLVTRGVSRAAGEPPNMERTASSVCWNTPTAILPLRSATPCCARPTTSVIIPGRASTTFCIRASNTATKT